MFSFGKKAADQENVLQDLNEEQLTQVAGGTASNPDTDPVLHPSKSCKSSKSSKIVHHHHHHHHHHVKDIETKTQN